MPKLKTHSIWPAKTGIMDIEGDIRELSSSEITGIKAIWSTQQERLQGSTQLSNFTEKLSREWAIETGAIENLYQLERGVTLTLIERGFQAELLTHGSTNKPQEYVINLLRDQKDALDGVFDFVKSERVLSTSYIKELHAALLRSQLTTEGVDSQGCHVDIPLIKGDWKALDNHPERDGVKYLYCPAEQVASEMDRMCAMHDAHIEEKIPVEIQAAWLHHRFTQIHPFQDGNGRVARAIASLVLVKSGLFPLVVTQNDKGKYLDALEAADNGTLKPLIDLFTKLQNTQFTKASQISEMVLVEEDVNTALDGLLKAADKIAFEQFKELENVFDLAKLLETKIEKRLKEIVVPVSEALQKVGDASPAFVSRSCDDNDYYYRAQIYRNAKYHLNYFADFTKYRSWVAMKMQWGRRCQIVFTVHGMGKPFNGSLVCAPFMEFTDKNEEGESENTFIPLTEEGFVFYYNEEEKRMLSRFGPWRENVLKIALKELTQQL